MDADTVLVPLRSGTLAKLHLIRASENETLDTLIDRIAGQEARSKGATSSPPPRRTRATGRTYRITLLGEAFEVSTLADVLVTVIGELAKLDAEFMDRLSEETGRSRRYVARKPEALYPGRSDLAQYRREVRPGWFVGTNSSHRDVVRILRAACEVAAITFGKDCLVEVDEVAPRVKMTPLSDF